MEIDIYIKLATSDQIFRSVRIRCCPASCISCTTLKKTFILKYILYVYIRSLAREGKETISDTVGSKCYNSYLSSLKKFEKKII